MQLYGGALVVGLRRARVRGANAAAVQRADGAWEVIQFANAELVGERTYLLSRLLRGQAGSEWAMGAPLPAGAPFVLLDDNVVTDRQRARRAGAQPAIARRRGQPRLWRCDRAGARRRRRRRRRCMPLAPVHVKAARGGSGVTFTWIRRTRIDGDTWVGEVPLGEDSEQYALDILSGASVVRTLTTATPLRALRQRRRDRRFRRAAGELARSRRATLRDRRPRISPPTATLTL